MTSSLPALDVDMWSDENLLDPFSVYDVIREMGPVVYLPRHDLYAVTRYDDVKFVLQNWELFSSATGVGFNVEMNAAMAGSLVASDPPRHRQLRNVLERPMAPAEMRSARLRIAELAREVVARAVARGEVEAVRDLATPIPVTLVADLVGLPTEGRERMLEWASAAFEMLAPAGAPRVAEAADVSAEMQAYFDDPTLPQRLSADSWASRLQEAAAAGEITREDAMHFLQFNYVMPALDTTVHATSSLIWLLARHEEAWNALRGNAALAGRAFTETLRLEGPIQAFSRTTTRPVTIGGVAVPAGVRLFVSFAAANRDPRHYPDPTRFDLDRDSSDHLALGYEEHVCLGRSLATLEITSLLRELTAQARRIEVLGSVRKLHNALRGFEQLSVRLTAS